MSAAGAAAGTGAAATDAAATDAATDSDEQHSKGPGAGAAGGSTLLDAHDTTLTACALEACCWPDLDLRDPSESSGGSSGSSCWVVCGTYQLVKGAEAEAEGSGSSKGDRREGSLLLYQLLGGEEDGRQRLVPRQALALKEEGVLDCKWCVRLCGCVCLGWMDTVGSNQQHPPTTQALPFTLTPPLNQTVARRPSSSSPGQQRRRPLLACATSRGRIATYTLEEADAPAAGGGTRDEEEEEEEHGPLLQLVPGPASDDDSGSSACMALALVSGRASKEFGCVFFCFTRGPVQANPQLTQSTPTLSFVPPPHTHIARPCHDARNGPAVAPPGRRGRPWWRRATTTARPACTGCGTRAGCWRRWRG